MGGSRKLTCLFPFAGSVQGNTKKIVVSCCCSCVLSYGILISYNCFRVIDLRCLELEREKADDFSPRGVLEACKEHHHHQGLENETASPKARISCHDSRIINSSISNRWHRFWKLWRAPKLNRLTSLGSLSGPKVPKRGSREHADDVSPKKCSWKNFTLSDLCSATNNFSRGPDCLLLALYYTMLSLYSSPVFVFRLYRKSDR